jgi:diguanylate cyclase (GGDEF)-like protein
MSEGLERWTPEALRAFAVGRTLSARTMDGDSVPLPAWLDIVETDRNAYPVSAIMSLMPDEHRNAVALAWLAAARTPGVVQVCRPSLVTDEGRTVTWTMSIVNLTDLPEVAAMVLASEDVVESDAGDAPIPLPLPASSPCAYAAFDRHGRCVSLSGDVATVFGFGFDEAKRALASLAMSEDQVGGALTTWASVIADPSTPQMYHQTHRHRNGDVRNIEITLVNRLGDPVNPVVFAIMRDVTDRRRELETLAASERRFRELAERFGTPLVIADREGAIRFANNRSIKLFGSARRNLVELASSSDRDRFRDAWAQAAASGGSFEQTFRAPDQSTVLRFRADLALGDEVFCTIEDVTSEQLRHDSLTRQAAIDPHTQLPNRFGLERHWEQLNRVGATIEVAFVDLDGFKAVNDEYGHSAGDDVIEAVADRLRSIAGADCCVARFGGDEFVVVRRVALNDLDEGPLADTIRHALRPTISHRGGQWTPAASVGVACVPAPSLLSEALRTADAAMYVEKRSHRVAHARRLVVAGSVNAFD